MSEVRRTTLNRKGICDFLPFCVYVVWISFFISGSAALAQNASQKPQSDRFTLSTRAQALMNERWNDSSFIRGMQIITNKTETRDSRAVAMELLHANRRNLKPNEMHQLLEEVTTIAKDPAREVELSAEAIRTMGNLTLSMEELGQLNRVEAIKETGFLLSVSTNPQRNIILRSQAINILGILRIAESSQTLQNLLNSSTNINVPDIARPICLSLMRIERERAVPVLADVLKRTSNSAVFGTAAFALGQIKNHESMIALSQNLERFPESGSCDAVLVDMENVVLEVLKNPQDKGLIEGIRATRHLWREGQRERYIPILQNLLTTASTETRKIVLDRLLEEASTKEFEQEKRELATTLELIKDQIKLSEYKEKIRSRLSATLVAPTSGITAPVPARQK